MAFWDSDTPPPVYTPLTDAQKQAKVADFKAQVAAHPEWLGADGAFKGPQSGANYQMEGLTPDIVINGALHPYQKPETDGNENANSPQATDMAFQGESALAHPQWMSGPDNGGGVFGGLARAIGNTATGIAHNPALMAGVTAGLAPMINPAISDGLQGMGLSAETATTAAPYVNSVGKTLLSGGNLKDAALSGVSTYAGNEVGGEVKDLTDSPFAGSAANQITQAALKGGINQNTLTSLATQYATGQLTDLTGLPPQVASLVASMAQGKKINPVGALTRFANSRGVGTPETQNNAVGALSQSGG